MFPGYFPIGMWGIAAGIFDKGKALYGLGLNAV